MRKACGKHLKHQLWRFDGKVFRSHHGNCLDFNYATGKVRLNDKCHEESWLDSLKKLETSVDWAWRPGEQSALAVAGICRLQEPAAPYRLKVPGLPSRRPEVMSSSKARQGSIANLETIFRRVCWVVFLRFGRGGLRVHTALTGGQKRNVQLWDCHKGASYQDGLGSRKIL